MKIYSAIKRGYLHAQTCDDYACHYTTANGLVVGMVADGCSSGEDSFFVSALYGKIISMLAAKLPAHLHHPNEAGDWLLNAFVSICRQQAQQLQLTTHQQLATLLLMVVCPLQKQAWVNVLGDGVLACNDQIYTIDHNNEPDYLAYHLTQAKQSPQNKLQNYLAKQVYQFDAVNTLSIATDGLTTFNVLPTNTNKTIFDTTIIEDKQPKILSNDAPPYLLFDKTMAIHQGMLKRKLLRLETQFALVPLDDLAILRVDLDN
ncbi:MAG: protein phosphatase 2C domain-containing protein [Sphingobacteriales bacterium]|jgi:hypothetical protein|nr:protein phosphatase 2C domain-containing protein [Sphingobacteriales bacterium]MBP9141347.1 protein phosphatase 2C domain-containing protein [Chitinophagales bacterium]MDA0198037.1 protein phosphatase 2C domain-containing protein [Bacteroidota bacterium]MBK6890734.1 protein phosphatase 2C domain-containing protein [Sphingobacteriales bacterium]MBK7526214.1 protein phosphatase 2C domain-containing protein [Sphingobacteriales bacterium]